MIIDNEKSVQVQKGGIVHKYFSECYKFDELKQNQITASVSK